MRPSSDYTPIINIPQQPAVWAGFTGYAPAGRNWYVISKGRSVASRYDDPGGDDYTAPVAEATGSWVVLLVVYAHDRICHRSICDNIDNVLIMLRIDAQTNLIGTPISSSESEFGLFSLSALAESPLSILL